jgi:hypothetical protein
VIPRKTSRSATADAVNEPRDLVSLGRRNGSEAIASHSANQRQVTICDGRDALGVVEFVNGNYTATDINGVIVGTFDSVLEAARSFKPRRCRPMAFERDDVGIDCPRCGRSVQVRKHKQITAKTLRQPYYYSTTIPRAARKQSASS